MDGRGGNEKKKEKEKEAPGEHHDGATGGPGQPARKSPAAQAKLGGWGCLPLCVACFQPLGALFPGGPLPSPTVFFAPFQII
jgi:hypothetical protein